MTERSRFYYRDPAAPLANQPRALSVIALIERDGALLFERRSDAPVWSLIAGRVEDTESLGDALRREVREETGLEVAAYGLFGTFSDPSRIVRYPDGNVYSVVSLVYSVEVASLGSLRPSSESEELRFFPRNRFPRDVPATQAPILDAFLSGRAPPHLQ